MGDEPRWQDRAQLIAILQRTRFRIVRFTVTLENVLYKTERINKGKRVQLKESRLTVRCMIKTGAAHHKHGDVAKLSASVDDDVGM